MKWISEEDLKEHIIRDNCDEGCGYIDERDIIDMEWVEDDKFIPLSVIGDVLDKIRAEIEQRPYGIANDSVIQGMKYERADILEIIDKYKASLTGWIPVSERLPKKGGDYLTTISFDIGAEEPVREVYKDFFCVLSQKWFYHNEDVIAWMPLPEPYKQEAEDEN